MHSVLHFLWKKGLPNKEIAAEISEVYGKEAASLHTVQWLVQHFNSGDECRDKHCSETPKRLFDPACSGVA